MHRLQHEPLVQLAISGPSCPTAHARELHQQHRIRGSGNSPLDLPARRCMVRPLWLHCQVGGCRIEAGALSRGALMTPFSASEAGARHQDSKAGAQHGRRSAESGPPGTSSCLISLSRGPVRCLGGLRSPAVQPRISASRPTNR